MNVHAPTVDKSDNTKDGFYDEVGRAFHEFSKYHMKTLLGDFNANVRRENTFKPTIGIESLHEISNDNGVTVVDLLHKKITVKSTDFSHCNIHKYTWTFPESNMHNQIDHILIYKMGNSDIVDV
jgi:hypothetical protein